MKRIRTLPGPTPGLASYLEAETAKQSSASWEVFRDHEAGASYRELREALTNCQRGLCGYCEIDLVPPDRQIEHVVPQSDPQQGAALALDPTNMIACCTGGSARSLYGPDAGNDEERYLPPAKHNISCGQAKDNNTNADFLDPRTLPALPSLLRVHFDGRIEADAQACAVANVSAERVRKTIELLKLNVERLRLAREKHWRGLTDAWQEHYNNPAVMEDATRMELLPMANGNLHRFFTTSRSYFAELAEHILAKEPAAWV